MMANSVVAVIENRHRDGNHLSLLQRQITVPVHQPIVKEHQRPQCRLVQAVGFDDVIYPTPGTGCPFINFGNGSCRLIFGNGFYPSHRNIMHWPQFRLLLPKPLQYRAAPS